jgi:hypothetical protein
MLLSEFETFAVKSICFLIMLLFSTIIIEYIVISLFSLIDNIILGTVGFGFSKEKSGKKHFGVFWY